MRKPEPVFEVDLGANGGIKRFYTHDEVEGFITEQAEAWDWLHLETTSNEGNIHRVRESIAHLLAHTRQHHIAWQADPSRQSQFEAVFRQAFDRIPMVGSPKANFVMDLRAESGSITAAGALGYFVSIVAEMQFPHPPILRGVLSAFAFEEGLSSKTTSTTRRSVEGLVNKFGKAHADLITQVNTEAQRFNDAEAYNLRFVDVMRRFVQHRLKRHQAHNVKELQQAIKRIDDTRDVYEQFMQLRGPVDYWMSKARAHQRKAKIHWDRLIKIAGWGGAGVLATLIIVARIAFDQAKTAYSNQPATLYLVLVTIGVVVTTMVFWAIRIQVRLYMSEHHMAVDAEERATMVKTYLALIEKHAADEKDRTLVLASLFRPTSDGIVRDDGAPEMSPAALLSKVLNKP